MVVVNITINTRRQNSTPHALITGGQCGGGGQLFYNKHPLKVVGTQLFFEYYLGPFFSYPPVTYRAIIQFVLYSPSILFVRNN